MWAQVSCVMLSQNSSGGIVIASAQPPANAAPNTSAPIRIVAETTVMTLGQTIRLVVEMGSWLMAWSCFKGRNLSDMGTAGKRKRPKNGPSRDIAGPQG